jgi:hypothetical protein
METELLALFLFADFLPLQCSDIYLQPVTLLRADWLKTGFDAVIYTPRRAKNLLRKQQENKQVK